MVKGRVLAIEDDEETRRLLRALLQNAGYDVALAAEGLAGLDWLEDNDCDLILLDMVMPGMNGWAFLRRLTARNRHPPVVVISARYFQSESLGDLDRHIWDYVKKPFKATVLVETCDRVRGASAGDGAAALDNRRGSSRYPGRIAVTLFSDTGIPFAKGHATNLSPAGAHVESDARLAKGGRVGLRFDVGEESSAVLAARVVWTQSGAAGLAFVDLTQEQRARVAWLLEGPAAEAPAPGADPAPREGQRRRR